MLAAEESALEAQEEMEAVQGVADEANEALAQVRHLSRELGLGVADAGHPLPMTRYP